MAEKQTTAYLKVFHKDTFIGTITDIVAETGSLKSGKIRLSAESVAYSHVFTYLLDTEAMTDGYSTPFDESYFDDWYFEDDRGNRRKTIIPGIYPHCEAFWTE